MTRDEVNNLCVGDVIEFSAAGCQEQWTVHDIVHQHDGSIVGVLARNIGRVPPISINIINTSEHWTLIEKAKKARPDMHPLEQLRQRLDNNNDS